MYGHHCALCGRLEVLHQSLNIRKGEIYLEEPDNWQDYHCGEEPSKEEIRDAFKHQRGYKHYLKNCPNFTYNAKVSESILILEALNYPSTIPYLEDDLREQVAAYIERTREQESFNYLPPQGTVYIIQRYGASFCLVGE